MDRYRRRSSKIGGGREASVVQPDLKLVVSHHWAAFICSFM